MSKIGIMTATFGDMFGRGDLTVYWDIGHLDKESFAKALKEEGKDYEDEIEHGRGVVTREGLCSVHPMPALDGPERPITYALSSTVNVSMAKKDFDFLKDLAEEMLKQDRRATADPYFFVVQGTRRYAAPSGYGDETSYYDREGQEEYSSKDDFKKKKMDEGWSEDEIEKHWEEQVEKCDMHHVDEEENFFLTERGYKKHMELNGHNYRRLRDVQSYVKHAGRNPEVKKLFEIIKSFAEK